MARLGLRLASCVVALSASGCSLAFMHKTPSRITDPTVPVECTTGRTGPAIDGFLAAGLLSGALALYVDATRNQCGGTTGGLCGSPRDLEQVAAAFSAAVGIGFALSTGVGLVESSRCRTLQERNRACVAGDAAECMKLAPDWRPASGGDLPVPPFAPKEAGAGSRSAP